jgi:hypothetical protein
MTPYEAMAADDILSMSTSFQLLECFFTRCDTSKKTLGLATLGCCRDDEIICMED